ncbi:MAG: hypothetical protein JW990_11980 [Thermoleophilia bacterium]|nr:hypothetical protein [Thermoleophilia bacterium]
MKEDVALTATGTPAIVLGKDRYPLVFTIAGMKEWAEHQGITFEQLMKEGWDASSLTEADMRLLLRIALVGGERRRALFDGGDPNPITDELLDLIMELSHPSEIIILLVKLWNEPPASKPDPPAAESLLPGD